MSVLNNICAQIRGKRANFLMKWTKFAEKMVSKMSNFIKYVEKISRAPPFSMRPPLSKILYASLVAINLFMGKSIKKSTMAKKHNARFRLIG